MNALERLLELAELLIEIRGELRVEPAELPCASKCGSRFDIAAVCA